MKVALVKTLFCLSFLCVSSVSSAAIITFDDRAAFESYIGAFTVDNLDGITQGASNSGVRDDYRWSMTDYGCVDSIGCTYGSDNPFTSPGNDWVWTYGSGTFIMDIGVSAFGLDYVDPYFTTSAQVGLAGFNSGINPNGSFFGIATTDGSLLYNINYTQFSTYQGFDNVTYSTTPNGMKVPEPSTLALFSLALMGLGFSARRRKA